MMHHQAVSFLLISLVVSSGKIQSVRGDEPTAEQAKDEGRAAEALELTREVARSLHFFGGEDRTTELTFVELPLQRYSNPIAGEFYAHLFIWTDKGRPAAAAAIAKWYAPRRSLHIELQSLATGSISAEYKQAQLWHPKEAGVTFNVIDGAPNPAGSAVVRLREMRQLAREFRARIKALNRGNVDEELRLLVKPVYRYESEDPTVLDGAIFSFVRGTDPELLLLIEARKVDRGFVWKYAFAPMNSFEFTASHGDREVWRKPQAAPPWQNTRDPTKPYMVYLAPLDSP